MPEAPLSEIVNGFWRVPYFLSFLLIIFAIWSRRVLPESQEFADVIASKQQQSSPIRDALQFSYRAMLQVIALNIFISHEEIEGEISVES